MHIIMLVFIIWVKVATQQSRGAFVERCIAAVMPPIRQTVYGYHSNGVSRVLMPGRTSLTSSFTSAILAVVL